MRLLLTKTKQIMIFTEPLLKNIHIVGSMVLSEAHKKMSSFAYPKSMGRKPSTKVGENERDELYKTMCTLMQ